MQLPIGEEEIGVIYKLGKELAVFYPVKSAFYKNIMSKSNPNLIQLTFSKFKEIYKYQYGISHRYRTSNKRI